MTQSTTEKHEFQAEVRQILDIVIHSLYTEREIFIRELVSNAVDALEQLRHIQITEKEIFDDNLPLEINISTDDTAGTITFQDFGVGMTREELVENLGTIAHSGSRAFLKALEEGADLSQNLIGQFGVGFYSSFMVADEVSVYTHIWKAEGEHLHWSSDGSGSFEIETIEGQRRGCKIIVKLKDENKEFAQSSSVKRILEHYSAFVPFPLNLNGDRINTVQALWLRNKNEITEEEYTEFYKFQGNAFDEPMLRLHFAADAPLAINALLFVPKENPERFGLMRVDSGVGLYCRKILIDNKPEALLPEWLRFLKGVVDSADLPLNISRETMQDNSLIQKLNRLLTRRFLKLLEEEAEKRPETYEGFWSNFSVFLKEGVAVDMTHREQLAKLLRYESSVTEKGDFTSLADYVSRMKESQMEIYYLNAQNREAIESGPYVEAFKARNLEVLYLCEQIDEFVMNHLHEFDGKRFVSVDQAELDLEDVPTSAEGEPLPDADIKVLGQWFRDVLGDRVSEVGGSKRLVDSPAIVLSADKFMSPGMRRMMQSMNQDVPASVRVNLELNPRHTLIHNLFHLREQDADLAKNLAEQVFDNALIAAGLLDDPRKMVDRIYGLLEKLSSPVVEKN